LLFDDLLGIADPDVELPKIDPDARRRRLTALVNAASLARETPALFVVEATSGPSGGPERVTVHASGRRQAGQVVATRTLGSSFTRLGMAKLSQAHPPHHRFLSPMTENPRFTVVKGWAMTTLPDWSSMR
jgi:hypothetical protein